VLKSGFYRHWIHLNKNTSCQIFHNRKNKFWGKRLLAVAASLSEKIGKAVGVPKLKKSASVKTALKNSQLLCSFTWRRGEYKHRKLRHYRLASSSYSHVSGVCVTNNNGFCIIWLDLLAHPFTVSLNHNQFIALSLINPLLKSLGHASSSQSSLVVTWQQIYNSLTVTTTHRLTPLYSFVLLQFTFCTSTTTSFGTHLSYIHSTWTSRKTPFLNNSY
jgi:hypothetical protein